MEFKIGDKVKVNKWNVTGNFICSGTMCNITYDINFMMKQIELVEVELDSES